MAARKSVWEFVVIKATFLSYDFFFFTGVRLLQIQLAIWNFRVLNTESTDLDDMKEWKKRCLFQSDFNQIIIRYKTGGNSNYANWNLWL